MIVVFVVMAGERSEARLFEAASPLDRNGEARHEKPLDTRLQTILDDIEGNPDTACTTIYHMQISYGVR